MNIKVKKLNDNARLPFRATNGSAGADLFACLEAPVTIEPGKRTFIPTGIAIEIPGSGLGGFLFPRSSLAGKHGVTLSNCVGVIDSDYRGEIKIAMVNLSDEPYTITDGERVAQLVIMPVSTAEFTVSEELEETARGEGGFGSTGKN